MCRGRPAAFPSLPDLPVCLRKFCWNLRAEPVPYLMKLNTFCQQNRLDPESGWYERALAAFEAGTPASRLGLHADEEKALRSFQLLTLKPEAVFVNRGDSG